MRVSIGVRLLYGGFALFIAQTLSFTNATNAVANDLDQMRLAARQLAGAQLPSGLLDFDINILIGEGFGSGDTDIEMSAFITREAAAAYVLAKYFVWTGDSSLTTPIQRLIATMGSLSLPVGKSVSQRWLESAHVLSIPIGRYKLRAVLDWFGLLYQPRGPGKLLSYESRYRAAWAGSTALALAAELEYFHATGDTRFAELRFSWLEGLRLLYIPGRGFREYPDSIEEQTLANGEAWLALATYAAAFPEDKHVSELLSAYDDYVIKRYSIAPDRQFYSWGTLAAAQRFATTSNPKFVEFIRRQASHFVDEKFLASQRHDNSCAFVEGLAAAAALLAKHKGDGELLQRLTARIESEMTKNRALQIPSESSELKFAGGTFVRSSHVADYAGAYVSGQGDLYARIDITAHCLSALIEMQGISAGPRQ